MALKIWLPLNGNINNKGLDETCTQIGTLTYAAGKIGQGLYMESAASGVGIKAPRQDKQSFTVCC